MKIIHCADLHLDSKMETNLSTEQAKVRRYELLATFERMVEIAVAENVAVIMIAGDMFDMAQSRLKKLKERVLDVIKSHEGIDFLYLQGNHDKDDYFKELGEKPENLKLFSNQWTSYNYQEVMISGIELRGDNQQYLYDQLILNENQVNIVMMHGNAVRSRTQPRVEDIVLSRLQDKFIDYLALGHLHTYQVNKLDHRGIYCYSGCLEGRGYDECGEKGFVLLDVNKEGIAQEFRPICKRMIHEIHVDVTTKESHQEIMEEIRMKVEKLSRQDYVKVVLVGNVGEEIDIDVQYIEQKFQEQFYTYKVEDKTETRIDYMKYVNDVSLTGEFIRCVQKMDLSEQDKGNMIRMGIHALRGKEIL